jgi:hypothetical protein
MMQFWVMLCEIISWSSLSFLPCHGVLALRKAILHPVEAHSNGLGSMLLDSRVCDASSDGVVSGDGSGVSQVACFSEGGTEGTGFLGVVKGCIQLCFSG